MNSIVYIGLGSNVGNRYLNLKEAIFKLAEKTLVLEISSIEETDPVGFAEQPKFLNCVVKARTDLKLRELFDFIKEVENVLGRKATFQNGPRVIDLDILFCNSEVIKEDDLEVPHPKIAERKFVLKPMAELSPDHRHPVLGKTMKELLSGLNAV